MGAPFWAAAVVLWLQCQEGQPEIIGGMQCQHGLPETAVDETWGFPQALNPKPYEALNQHSSFHFLFHYPNINPNTCTL